MTIYKCLTHGLTMIIQDNKRDIRGAVWGHTPPCKIALMPKEPVEGKFGECVVVKEQ